MSFFSSPRFLPRVLALDAVTCVGAGLVQVFGGEMLAELLQLPSAPLLETGLFLLAYAAALVWVARRPVLPRKLVALFAVGNLGWGIASIALMAGPWVAPSTFGMIWLGIHAASTLLLGDLQLLGLRGSRHHGRLAMAS